MAVGGVRPVLNSVSLGGQNSLFGSWLLTQKVAGSGETLVLPELWTYVRNVYGDLAPRFASSCSFY